MSNNKNKTAEEERVTNEAFEKLQDVVRENFPPVDTMESLRQENAELREQLTNMTERFEAQSREIDRATGSLLLSARPPDR